MNDVKLTFRAPFKAVVVLACLLAACSPENKPQAETPAKSAEPESRVTHGTNGETTLTLEAATQQLMGLQTTPLEATRLNPEIKGYGRVLDIAPLASLVGELTTAQAASATSQAELKRLQTLAAQNNASERALQAAEAVAARDRTQVESARLRLLAAWGSAIANRQDLPAFVQSLASLAAALVQLELPAGERVTAAPTAARLVSLAEGGQPVEAQFISPAPVVDPQMQGRGFLFLVPDNSLRLIPGAAVTGFISFPGEAQPGVVMPRAAVVRHNGAAWAYIQTAEDKFQRVAIALDRPLTNGWFVPDGLRAEAKVVTVGAQQLLSEELKGQGEE